MRALDPAAALLASEGVLMRYTDLSARLDRAAKGLTEQEGGTHADEVETSMMLYIDPSSVDMTKAVKDYTPSPGGGRLTRQRGGSGTYFADRHLGRSDARDAREGAGLRRSARRGHPRGHREPANGAAAAPIVHGSASGGSTTSRPPQRRPRPRRLRRSAARPVTNGRSSARQRIRQPLEQRRLRAARRDVVEERRHRPPRRRRSSEARSSSPSIACNSSRGASIGTRATRSSSLWSDVCRKTSPSPTASGS